MEKKTVSTGELLLNIDLERQYDSLIEEYNRLFKEELFFLNQENKDAPTPDELKQYELLMLKKEQAKINLPKSGIDFKMGIAYKKPKERK